MKKLLIVFCLQLAVVNGIAQDGNLSMEWKKIEPFELQCKPMNLFANDWMALAMGNRDKCNAMTIGWGSLGHLWGKNIVIVYVSKDRYSKKMMDENEYFTVTAFPDNEASRKALQYIGTKSYRDDPNKIANAGLTTEFTELGNPVFREGNLTIECKTIYKDEFKKELLPADVRENMYERFGMGLHSFYIGEIVNIWEK